MELHERRHHSSKYRARAACGLTVVIARQTSAGAPRKSKLQCLKYAGSGESNAHQSKSADPDRVTVAGLRDQAATRLRKPMAMGARSLCVKIAEKT